VVNIRLRPLYPPKRHVVPFVQGSGGGVGPGSVWKGAENLACHRDSISITSRPWQAATPVTLSRYTAIVIGVGPKTSAPEGGEWSTPIPGALPTGKTR
jgi:hypothetical protein